jgi:hypothetical protein
MKVLVTGHTDTVGSSDTTSACPTSAAAMAAYTTDAVDTWLAWYGGGALRRHARDQHMLTVCPTASASSPAR